MIAQDDQKQWVFRDVSKAPLMDRLVPYLWVLLSHRYCSDVVTLIDNESCSVCMTTGIRSAAM